jgi:hypothetical protein
VTVANAELSEGGFVVIHSTPVVPDNGTAADSVIGNSEFIADSASDIQITLDEPITANTTLVAMAHRDTDGDQAYNFPELNGTAVDGPYVFDGAPVVDPANITVQTTQPGAANLSVTSLSAPTQVAPGDNVTVEAGITNVGTGAATNETVEFRFDLNQDGELTANETLASQDVSLNVGASTTVTFEVSTVGVDNGTYTHGVFTATDSATATIEVNASAAVGPDWTGTPIEGATSTDDDDFPEDIDGNGEVNLDDVFAFAFDAVFAQDGTFDATQSAALDYNGDGTVDLDDVFEFAFGEALG